MKMVAVGQMERTGKVLVDSETGGLSLEVNRWKRGKASWGWIN